MTSLTLTGSSARSLRTAPTIVKPIFPSTIVEFKHDCDCWYRTASVTGKPRSALSCTSVRPEDVSVRWTLNLPMEVPAGRVVPNSNQPKFSRNRPVLVPPLKVARVVLIVADEFLPSRSA